MATFQAMLSSAGGNATAGQAMPLPVANSRGGPGGTVTTSGSSQVVKDNSGDTVVAPQAPGLLWHIAVDGGPVWVNFGPSPVAVAGGDGNWLLSAGDSLDLVAVAGDSCAVIDAT